MKKQILILVYLISSSCQEVKGYPNPLGKKKKIAQFLALRGLAAFSRVHLTDLGAFGVVARWQLCSEDLR
jgi:hypothetical protein